MIKLLFSFIFIISLDAAMITGSQNKLSISGGNMNVTAGGVTQAVNSGEITFIEEGSAPTRARRLNKNDLKDITNELSMSSSARTVNLKYAPVKRKLAKKISRFLLKVGIQRANIKLTAKNKTDSILYVRQIDIESIKNIYPLYYKALGKYYTKNEKKLRQKSKTPTVLIKLKMIRRYHKSLYNKYH